jgi:hypothetical protein
MYIFDFSKLTGNDMKVLRDIQYAEGDVGDLLRNGFFDILLRTAGVDVRELPFKELPIIIEAFRVAFNEWWEPIAQPLPVSVTTFLKQLP